VILKLEGKQQDHSRLVGSLLTGGVWLLLMVNLPKGLRAVWRDCFRIGGWFPLGLGAYMHLRRKLWRGKAKRAAAQNMSSHQT